MRNPQTFEVGQANLIEHRAVKAWARLCPPSREPIRVTVLKPENKTSSVYRLEGVGPSGCAVIAKRKRIGSMALELTVYREILRHLTLRTLDCYGFIDDPDPAFGWLFLQDAGDRKFDFNNSEHRALAAEWFAGLHGGAARHSASAKYLLPSRGLEHWRKIVLLACDIVRRSLVNPAFSADDLRILRAILSRGEVILLHWDRAQELCQPMPETVVHGDFCPKNARVGDSSNGLCLFPIDWDCAGWGLAAVDLSHTDINRYWSAARLIWPGLELATVEKFANFGRMLWAFEPITGETEPLVSSWVGNVMRKMTFYHAEIEDATRSAGWLR